MNPVYNFLQRINEGEYICRHPFLDEITFDIGKRSFGFNVKCNYMVNEIDFFLDLDVHATHVYIQYIHRMGDPKAFSGKDILALIDDFLKMCRNQVERSEQEQPILVYLIDQSEIEGELTYSIKKGDYYTTYYECNGFKIMDDQYVIKLKKNPSQTYFHSLNYGFNDLELKISLEQRREPLEEKYHYKIL